jgi:hypothetical protein
MERILTTQEATVQTVQVEIKALKVGKKQVTMGLFRQLPHSRLIDPETVQLRGVPWGHVRYWWDGDESGFGDGPKLHVVWQLGDELRRGVVFKEPDPSVMHILAQRIEDLIGDWVIVRLASASTFKLTRGDHIGNRRTAELGERECTVNFDEAVRRVLETYWDHRDRDPETEAQQYVEYMRKHDELGEAAAVYAREYARVTERKAQALQGYRVLLEVRGLLGSTPEQVVAQIHKAQAERDAYKDAWAKQWQVLSALPQLFIAV